MSGTILDERCAEMKQRMQKRRDELRLENLSRKAKGLDGEIEVREWLKLQGFDVLNTRINSSPYDLLVNGKVRIEVKTSPFRDDGWHFNIHRHGVLDEGEVDVYVFRCESGIETRLVVALAPVRVKTIHISLRQLSLKWAANVGNVSLIRNLC